MADTPQGTGSGLQKPTPPPKPNVMMAEMTRKLEDLTAKFTLLERDQTTLKEGNSQLSAEVSNLRIVVTALQADNINHNKLRNDHDKLHQYHNKLQQNHNKLQKENASLRGEHNSLQKELHQEFAEIKVYTKTFQEEHTIVVTDQSNLRKHQDKLKKDQDKVKTEISNMRPGQQTLLSDVAKLREDVLNQMASMRKEMTSLPRDLPTMKDTDKAQLGTELHNLRQQNETNHSKLREEVAKIQEDQRQTAANHANLLTEVNSLKAQQRTLRSEMDTVSSVQRTLHTDVSNLKADSIDPVLAEQRRLQQNQDTLTSDVGTLRTDVERMDTSLQQSLTKVTKLQTRLGKAGPMFAVHGLNKARTVRGQAMIFQDVEINEEGCFKVDSGRFTVPHEGLYYCNTFVTSNKKGSTVQASIMRDDAKMCGIQGGVEIGTGGTLVQLTAGDEVWMNADSDVDQFAEPIFSAVHKRWNYRCGFIGTLVVAYD